MRIGYVQSSPVFGEKEKNYRQIDDLLSGMTADLIVLPELFATGYTFVSKEEVGQLGEESVDRSETYQFLQEMSARTKAVIAGGFIEKENGRCYNASMMVCGKELIGIYRKIHLFNKEKIWFSPGDRSLRIYEVKGVKIGMMICFDWIFPEVCRNLALKGAQIMVHPSNLVLPYGQQAMVTRCLENRVYAITANRIGTEIRGSDHFVFTGRSQITSVDGTILSSAPEEKTCACFAEIDIQKARDKSINEYNDVFTDRRPEMYRIQ